MNKKRKEIFKKAYDKVNSWLLFTTPFNNKETREEVRALLEISLRDVCDKVICDETNNSPDIIDKNQCVARVIYDTKKYGSFTYIDLYFGRNISMGWDNI